MNCGVHQGRGKCDLVEGCKCSEGYKGDDCGQLVVNGFWETVVANSFAPPGSASHGVAVWRDYMYVLGGESYNNDKKKMIHIYDINGKFLLFIDCLVLIKGLLVTV